MDLAWPLRGSCCGIKEEVNNPKHRRWLKVNLALGWQGGGGLGRRLNFPGFWCLYMCRWDWRGKSKQAGVVNCLGRCYPTRMFKQLWWLDHVRGEQACFLQRWGTSGWNLDRTSHVWRKPLRDSCWHFAAHILAEENVWADRLSGWGCALPFLSKLMSLTHFCGVEWARLQREPYGESCLVLNS